jgi:predicted hotdog family 3-hydroxylacyl-ACP dehydratase
MMDPLSLIEDLIPHRGEMRLIDTILSVDQDHAVTQATVGKGWPMMTPNGVNPLILIELAAQTAGVCFGWNEQNKPAENRMEPKGWLVGVKSARFDAASIAMATRITIKAQHHLIVEQYKEIAASASIGDRQIAEIHFQVLQAEKSGFALNDER